MAAHTNNNVVVSRLSFTTKQQFINIKRKRSNDVAGRRNNNWGKLTSHSPSSSYSPSSIETNVVCLCLSLGGSCFPSCCSRTADDDIDFINKKRKLAEQETNLISTKNKKIKIANDAAVVIETRNWDCSTEWVLYDDPWKIKKVLTQTDLGHNSRLLLNKDLANDFVVPVLGAKAARDKGVYVKVWDIDTNSLHSLVFKIRPSNQSPVFKETWIRDFVLRRGLKKGDEIGMHWDPYEQRFDFSVLRPYRRQVTDQH